MSATADPTSLRAAYINYNCHFLDGNEITFGNGVLLAPLVQIYAATHSIDVVERKEGWQRAYAVDIGDDVSGHSAALRFSSIMQC